MTRTAVELTDSPLGLARVRQGAVVVRRVGVGLATVGVYAAILVLPVLALRLIARWS
jgi:hypothetical protein